MRLRPFFTTLGLLAAAACASPDSGSIIEQTQSSTRTGDFDGVPDLIVDVHTLSTSWIVYDHELREGTCSLHEENLSPGQYRLLRFTVGTPNIGTADLYIGDPNVHWDPNGDLNPDDSDGLFEYSTCHGHFHYSNYARYELIAKDGTVTKARKTGFCMLDIHPFSPAHKTWAYRSCGRPPDLRFGIPGTPGNQGVSVGWSDEYDKWLDGQFFVLNDPNAPEVPPGDYTLRITVNPPFTGTPGGFCPAVDSHGLCHGFRESDYDNNVGEIAITIPAHPGKTGFGPGATKNPPDEEGIDDGSDATK
jgi:lysyl oxidase